MIREDRNRVKKMNCNIRHKARITAVHRDRYELETMEGKEREQFYGRLKRSIYYTQESKMPFPTVGDYVEVNYNESGDSLILATLSRKSYFSRLNPTPGMGEQVVAANFDYVFITMSLNKDFNVKKLERYVTAAWQSGGTPVVILTKADACEEGEKEVAQRTEEVKAHAPGVEVVVTSSLTGYGMEQVREYLKPGKVIVFLGSSGVGKSTFINALFDREVMKTGAIREEDSRGRHTTTYRQLLTLPGGACVIDTPGMRELGMWDVSEGLGQSFGEIEELIKQCKFTNCTHTSEPGCAIVRALENGTLEKTRWRNYCKLKQEAKYSDSREDYLQRMQQWGKKNARQKRNEKKYKHER